MKDCFFTFGGRVFWEDLFVKHGWRIQRNLTSKKFRLLDNFDIVRFEGSYKKALAEFSVYSAAYELDKKNNNEDLVIMLHGYGQSGKIFKTLADYLRAKRIDAQSIEYPSTQRRVVDNAKQLNMALDNLTDYKQVSFVTFGSGNILLEEALRQRKNVNPHINKIVEISPNMGNIGWLAKISRYDLFKFIFGETCFNLAAENIASLHHIPNAQIGVINIKDSKKSFLSPNKPTRADEEVKNWCGAQEILSVFANRSNVLNLKNVHEAVFRFLTSSKLR